MIVRKSKILQKSSLVLEFALYKPRPKLFHSSRKTVEKESHSVKVQYHFRSRWSTSSERQTRLYSSLSVSDVSGPDTPPLVDLTIGQLIQETAARYGDKPAVISVHQNITLSYNELDRLSDILAKNLMVQGVNKGDAVGVCAGSLWQYHVLQIGLAKLGAVLVPLNPAFTVNQFVNALSRTKAVALIVQDKLGRGRSKPSRDGLEIARDCAAECPLLKRVYVTTAKEMLTPEFADHIGHTDGYSIQPLSDLLEQRPPNVSLPNLDVDEPINMQFTSGTTSLPKISCLSHKNLVNNGRFISLRMGLKAEGINHPSGQDHLCVPVPMFHCFGLVLSNMAALSSGACLVLPSDSFDPRAVFAALRAHNCTALHGVPTMFAAELDLEDEIEKGGTEYLRTGIAAGSSVPAEMMRKLVSKFNLSELTICYGMTETSPVSFMSFPNDTLDRRVSTVGKVMPHTHARIVAVDSLVPLPVNKPGEIVISGYLLQSGYYEDIKKTEEAMVYDDNGVRWMRTGDEGVIDEHGYMRVTGRIKDLIIRGGENIHPLEIENVLFSHPAILQASVVGVPDEKYGEAVAAFIILEHGHKQDPPSVLELSDLVNEKLGHYMVPKYWYFVEDFPKTASGKIRKVDLKSIAVDKLKDNENKKLL
jgi:acyl-CoA synthetase (AMP-forming)/AMP-acid ligase II